MGNAIFFFGLLIFIAYFLTIIFNRTKIPDVLLLMLIGILVGPMFFNMTSPEYFGRFGNILTNVALIVILFEGGINLNLKLLKNAWDETLLISIPTFALTMCCVAFFAHLVIDLPVFQSFLLGAILGGTSSAVVLPIIRSFKMGHLSYTALFIESALTDVLAIVITFSLIKGYQYGGIKPGLIAGNIIATLIVATIIGGLGGYLWSILLDKVRGFPNNLFSTIAFIFILYGVTEYLGFNGAICALAFGITLSNLSKMDHQKQEMLTKFSFTKLRPTEKLFFQELVFLLKIFFFIYLGMSINFCDFKLFLWSILASICVFLLRMIVVKYLLPKKINQADASVIAVMVPKGLAAAVLATLPFQMGIIENTDAQSFVYSMILLTITFSAILVSLIQVGPIQRFYFTLFSNFSKCPEPAVQYREPPPHKKYKKK